MTLIPANGLERAIPEKSAIEAVGCVRPPLRCPDRLHQISVLLRRFDRKHRSIYGTVIRADNMRLTRRDAVRFFG